MFFYVRTTTYRARTGPVDTKLPYACAHCGVTATALVRSEGNAQSVAVYGGGGSAEAAKKKAFEQAQSNALHALRTSACPSCGKLQPPVLGEYDKAAKRLAWRRKVGVPLALALPGTFGLLLAALGIAKSGQSTTALFVALPLAFTFAAFWVGVALRRWKTPLERRTGSVWFWWTPPPTYREAGPAQWRPASAPAAVPELRQPPRNAFVVGLLLSALGVVATFTAIGINASMYDSVYVLNTSGAEAFNVTVDGKVVGHVAPGDRGPGKDLAYETFEVRSGKAHHIEVTTGDGAGSTHSYDLSAQAHDKGWLVAPDSLESDLCILDEEVVYGSGEPADPDVLNQHSDLIELPHSYDDFFETPPSTMSTEASRVTRRALRGYDCTSPDGSAPRAFWEKPASKAK